MTFIQKIQENRSTQIAIIGDIGVYLLATILGFLSHAGESDPTINRMAATFLPFIISWTIIAPWLGVYHPDTTSDPKSLWRPVLATLYAAPVGAFGRSLWLDSPTLPLFVIIMAGVIAGLMFLWRGLLTRLRF
jgi:hypothetical protein